MLRADCHNDHKMFRARAVCGLPKSFRKLSVERPPGMFDVSCLKGDCVDEQGKMTATGLCVNGVSWRLQDAWNQEGSVEEKWTLLKTALTDTAQSTLGTQKEVLIGLRRIHPSSCPCMSKEISFTSDILTQTVKRI